MTGLVAMSENGKPSGLGKTAAHGKHMDEKRSRDVHWKEEEDLLQRRVISFPQRPKTLGPLGYAFSL